MGTKKNIFEWMLSLGCMTHDDVDYIYETREFLVESQESKSKDQAKKLYRQRFPNASDEDVNKFIEALRNDLPVLKGDGRVNEKGVKQEGGKFILGVARMYLDGELRDASTIGTLNTTLMYASSPDYINKFDKNLNELSAQDIISQFEDVIKADNDADRQRDSQVQRQANTDYQIVPINDFEEASQYGNYTDWCIAHRENMFDNYTHDGVAQFYFCLRNNFENEPKEQGENCPLDSYGLSMIAVCVDENGRLKTCTCRWNHDNGGNDNIMNTEQISDVLGVSFYNAFKPNNKWQATVEDAMQRLKNGERVSEVMDDYRLFRYDGFLPISLKKRWNFIDTEDNLLSPNQWFDYVDDFCEGFAKVKLNREYNYIDTKGSILSPNQWFDDVDGFERGLARVVLNDKYNFMDSNGNILFPNQWFDWYSYFREGFAKVKLNGKYNYIDTKGNLLTPNQWYDDGGIFVGGFAKIRLNDELYQIDAKGNLTRIR